MIVRIEKGADGAYRVVVDGIPAEAAEARPIARAQAGRFGLTKAENAAGAQRERDAWILRQAEVACRQHRDALSLDAEAAKAAIDAQAAKLPEVSTEAVLIVPEPPPPEPEPEAEVLEEAPK